MSGIEIRNVSKSFGSTQALREVSLTVEPGKIYGLLGRNGAGKSTLLNLITNRIFPDSGEILADGEPVQENDRAQQKLYLMSEKTYYPERMKVRDSFRWTRSFYPSFDEEYARKLAEAFDLNTGAQVRSLSTGYLSIFKLVTALSCNVPYVLLDEPVLGLDANHRDLFYKILLAKYTENPFTVVLSTHLIEEVSSLVEDVVIIKAGSVICRESRESLLGRGYTVSGTAAEVDAYIRDKEVIGMDSLGGLRTAYLLGRPEAVPAGLSVTSLDLQKLFIQLTDR